jgi:hypothetical protein
VEGPVTTPKSGNHDLLVAHRARVQHAQDGAGYDHFPEGLQRNPSLDDKGRGKT